MDTNVTEQVILDRLKVEAQMTYRALNSVIADLEAAKTRMLEGNTPGWGLDRSLDIGQQNSLNQHVARIAELSTLAAALVEDRQAVEESYAEGCLNGMTYAERKAVEDVED